MSKTWPHYKLTPTRFKLPTKRDPKTGEVVYDACQLFFGKAGPGRWRFVVNQLGYSECGETYCTKDELLADMNRYAEAWGFTTP